MARRGPKGKSPEEQKAAGETRPCRKVETLFASHAERPDPDHIPAPVWLNKKAKELWTEKTNRYRQRGQKIEGFESALAQFCALEADLINFYKKKITPPMAMVNALRVWAAEFYDTPASQRVPAGGSKPNANKFKQNGNRTQP